MAETRHSLEARIAMMRSAYEAWPKDPNAYLRHFREDAIWHSNFGGEVSGKDAIAAFLTRLLDAVEEYHFDIHDIVANDDHIVVLGRNDLRLKNGQALENELSAEVFHLDDDGQVKEVWPLLDTDRWRKALAGH